MSSASTARTASAVGTARARVPSLATRLGQAGIVAAAVLVFTRRGFAETRVEDLLAEAGVARRTFYRYFRSKEDVLAVVYELATSELLAAVRAGDLGAGRARATPLAGIERGLDVYLDYHVENAPLLRVLVEQAIRSDSPLAEPRRRFRSELVRLLGDAVRAERRAAHDPMLYAALVSALEGLSLDLLAAAPKLEQVRRAKKVMHQLLRRALSPGG